MRRSRLRGRRLSVALALVCVCARAQSDAPHERASREGSEHSPVAFELQARFGVVQAPFFTPEFAEVQAHGFVVSLAAEAWLSPAWQLGMRAPLALMSIQQPAGSYLDEAAWGNPSLFVLRRSHWHAGLAEPLSAWLGVELALPLAESGPSGSLIQNQALEAANALTAYRSPQAFSPGAWSLVPRAGAAFERGPLGLRLELEIPLLVRVADAALPDSAKTHSLGLWPGSEVEARLRWMDSVQFSLAANATLALLRVVDPVTSVSPLQLSLRPKLQFRLGRRLELDLAFLVPLAGPLGGSTYAAELGLRSR